jgi:hypothetical protein
MEGTVVRIVDAILICTNVTLYPFLIILTSPPPKKKKRYGYVIAASTCL